METNPLCERETCVSQLHGLLHRRRVSPGRRRVRPRRRRSSPGELALLLAGRRTCRTCGDPVPSQMLVYFYGQVIRQVEWGELILEGLRKAIRWMCQTGLHDAPYRALWFLRSRHRGIGRLKQNLFFIVEFDIISLKCCFPVEEECMSGENCTEGSKTGWNNKRPSQNEPLPCQNNVSMAKRLPTAPSLSAKKTEKLDINPSVQSRAVPERLVCVKWTVVLQRSRPERL